MQYRERLQKVNISMEKAICSHCGTNILDVMNIRCINDKLNDTPMLHEELYACRKCGIEFVIQYDLFDAEGHIQQRMFSGDPNDPMYHWPDILTAEQRSAIAKHIKDCSICTDRLDKEIELDTWFADILHNKGVNL